MRRTNTSESLGGIVIYSGVRVALLLLLSCGILRTRLVSSRCHGAFVAVPTGQHNHRHCLAQQNPPPMVETRFSGSPPTKRHQRALGNNNNIGGRCFMLNNNYLSSLTTGSSSANPRENSDAPNRAVVVSPKPNTAPWKPNASAAAVPLASPALASYQTGSYLDNLVGVPPLHSDASSSSASFQNDSNARNTYNSNNDSNRNEAPLQQQQRGSSLPPQSSSYLDSLKSSRGPERSQQQPPPPFGRATPATSGITRPPPWRPPSNSEQQQSSAASSSSSWVSYGDPTTSQQQQYSASTSRTPPAWIQPLGQLLNQQQQQPPMSEASPLGNDGGPSNDSGSAPPTFAYQNPMRQQQQQVSSSSAASSPWNSSPMFKQQQGSEQQTSQSSSSSNRPAPWSPYQNNSNIELQNIVNNESRNSVGPTSSFPSTTSGGVDTGSSSNSRPAPWTPRKDMGATPPPQSTWVSYGTPTTTTNPTAATSALQQNPVFDKDAPRIAAWQQSSLTDCVASRPEKPWKPLPFSNAEERPAAWSPPQKKVDRPSPWSPRKNDNAGSPSTTPSWTGSNSIFATSNTNPSSETDGVAIPYSSFSDSMESTEDEVDERTAAEILAEKMRAASLDVEILEQQITTDDSYHNKLRENNEYETEGSFYFDNQRNVTGNAPINFNDWENEIGSGLPPLNDTTTPLASKFFDQRRPVNDTFRSSPKNMPIKENRDFRTKQMPDRPVTSFTPNGPPQPPIRVQQKQKIPAMQETSFHGVGGDSKRSMGGSVKEGKAAVRDEHYMRMAMRLAMSSGSQSSFPNPNVGAVLVAEDGTILSRSHSDFRTDAIRAALANAGLQATPGANEWVVTWPMSEEIRYQLASSTLYITLEPSTLHPITSLVGQAGISRVVIGSLDPVPEYSGKGAAALQAAGIAVSHFTELADECDAVIQDYAVIANGKLQRMAREHLEIFGRPLGMLHCSVIDSDIVKAFSKQGSVIGAKASEDFIPTIRNDGTFELAPPPDLVWVGEQKIGMALEESSEYYPEEDDDALDDESSPITWYGQADAAIASFPRPGDGPPDDDSVAGRLFGLRWLATHGRNLPAGVERILVLDSSDLKDLPLSNDDPNLDLSFDVETFWAGKNRKPTRIILRRGEDRMAQSLAQNAAAAAMKAAEAAALAVTAILPADVARATEMAIECQKTAQASADVVLKELRATSEVRRKLEAKGVIIDSIEGKEPIDVMKHLGSMHGVHSVIWRAGCWGERGVRMILAGAFQRLSAHVTVPATGGQFWQMMVAENAVQSACGPRTKVKVFSSEKNMNLEHCDKGDEDCVHMQNGHPIRYVRLDCRVSLMDDERAREFIEEKDAPVRENAMSEDGQWFL